MCAIRTELNIIVSAGPRGNLYGVFLRNTWPTLEQPSISSWPPHIQIWFDIERFIEYNKKQNAKFQKTQTLNESSKFSPPQICMPSSKAPIS